MCGRCVRACNEKQVNQAISIGYRGAHNKMVTVRTCLQDSDCVFCGECVQSCPVGALLELKAMAWPGPGKPGRSAPPVLTAAWAASCGCTSRAARSSRLPGWKAPPNQGRLCVKGRFGYDFIYSPERLTMPLIKENGEFREASWDEALDLVADKLKEH